ncbi:uncharacterized protein LOC129985109 [Argiope bruennichi]|uniref:uncharacterized protein LOC129985109 n=1 Tax=Argiope bruennichi TaxID=94029 RepID=UPI002494334E|nr:uncharacterized protein LOC129985109 [Argiope bruennichi]
MTNSITFFWVVAVTSVLAQPEYTTPGGILVTNCHKGCTEVAVHESNCYPPCDSSKYERCVLETKMLEPSCFPQNQTTSYLPEVKRPYVCRCYPCLYRNENRVCMPACPQPEEET